MAIDVVKIPVSELGSENKFGLSEKLWGEFKSPEAKTMYNRMREMHESDQSLFVHPKTKLPSAQWVTIVHNMACNAAWEVDRILKK